MSLKTDIDNIGALAALLDTWINGSNTQTITTDWGTVSCIAKVAKDAYDAILLTNHLVADDLRVGTASTISSGSEKVSVLAGTDAVAATFKNSSATVGTVIIKNDYTAGNAYKPFITLQDASANRGVIGIHYNTAGLFIDNSSGGNKIELQTGGTTRVSITSTLLSGSVAGKFTGAIDSYTALDSVNISYEANVGTISATRTGGNYSSLAFKTSGADGNGVTRLAIANDGSLTNAVAGTTRLATTANGADVTGTLSATGGAWFGSAALATGATTGHLYIPTSAGAPTGVPAAKTGQVAFQYDSTNNKLYAYNGAWKSTAALT